jgi:choline kinase
MIFIILAAGMGVRASSHLSNCPKVLLKAGNGRSLLVNMLDRIQESHPGNPQIRVVAGFLHEQVLAEVNNYSQVHPNVNIKVVGNEIYERGVITSLFRGLRDVNTDVVILNGDTYYPGQLFSNLSGLSRSTLLVLPSDDQPDSVRVNTEDGQIIQVGKRLVEFNYISTGCLYLEKPHVNLVENKLSDLIEQNAFEGMIWHNVINLLIQQGVKIDLKLIQVGQIFEIDTKEDYQNFLTGMTEPG